MGVKTRMDGCFGCAMEERGVRGEWGDSSGVVRPEGRGPARGRTWCGAVVWCPWLVGGMRGNLGFGGRVRLTGRRLRTILDGMGSGLTKRPLVVGGAGWRIERRCRDWTGADQEVRSRASTI